MRTQLILLFHVVFLIFAHSEASGLVIRGSSLIDCHEEISVIEDAIFELVDDVDKILLQNEKGFYPVSEGSFVHESCLDYFGKELFLESYREAYVEGLSCLIDLEQRYQAKTGKAGSRALKNAKSIQEVLRKSHKVYCAEEDFQRFGNELYAYGSSRADDETLDGHKHPFISMNPNFIKNEKIYNNLATHIPTQEVVKKMLSLTLFHEAFHNIGHHHHDADEIEVAYPCQVCCFGKGLEKPQNIELSCKICTGDYLGTTDPEYRLDLKLWKIMNKSFSDKVHDL